jgi:hypothetical protein
LECLRAILKVNVPENSFNNQLSCNEQILAERHCVISFSNSSDFRGNVQCKKHFICKSEDFQY